MSDKPANSLWQRAAFAVTAIGVGYRIQRGRNSSVLLECQKFYRECGATDAEIKGIGGALVSSQPASGYILGHIRLVTTAEKMLEDAKAAGVEGSVAKQRVLEQLFRPIIDISQQTTSRGDRKEKIQCLIRSLEGDRERANVRFTFKRLELSAISLQRPKPFESVLRLAY